jgi:signal transduction histidine kinase
VVKHSQATFLSVQLYKSKNTLILLVEDNGKGMDTNVKEKEGIGLKNMSSRINSINGGISFEPSPNAGMVATIRVPIL